jgi:hypothetical protein
LASNKIVNEQNIGAISCALHKNMYFIKLSQSGGQVFKKSLSKLFQTFSNLKKSMLSEVNIDFFCKSLQPRHVTLTIGI